MAELSKKEIQEKINLLEEARTLIEEAITKIEDAVSNTDEEHRAEAYIIPSLKMCCYNETGYLGSQPSNIEELIDSIDEMKNE